MRCGQRGCFRLVDSMSAAEAFIWSFALSGSNLGVFALTGRRSRRVRAAGWWLTIATEPLWAWYGSLTGGWAFVALAFFYAAVAVLNLRTLSQEATA